MPAAQPRALPLCPGSSHINCLQGWVPLPSVCVIPTPHPLIQQLLGSERAGVTCQHPYLSGYTWEGWSIAQRPGQVEGKGWRRVG